MGLGLPSLLLLLLQTLCAEDLQLLRDRSSLLNSYFNHSAHSFLNDIAKSLKDNSINGTSTSDYSDVTDTEENNTLIDGSEELSGYPFRKVKHNELLNSSQNKSKYSSSLAKKTEDNNLDVFIDPHLRDFFRKRKSNKTISSMIVTRTNNTFNNWLSNYYKNKYKSPIIRVKSPYYSITDHFVSSSTQSVPIWPPNDSYSSKIFRKSRLRKKNTRKPNIFIEMQLASLNNSSTNTLPNRNKTNATKVPGRFKITKHRGRFHNHTDVEIRKHPHSKYWPMSSPYRFIWEDHHGHRFYYITATDQVVRYDPQKKFIMTNPGIGKHTHRPNSSYGGHKLKNPNTTKKKVIRVDKHGHKFSYFVGPNKIQETGYFGEDYPERMSYNHALNDDYIQRKRLYQLLNRLKTHIHPDYHRAYMNADGTRYRPDRRYWILRDSYLD